MTLEELKVYREKCLEVQNTIKRDCEYIEKDIKASEEVRTQNFEDFVKKVQELLQYLPSDEELDSVSDYMKYDYVTKYLGNATEDEKVYVFYQNKELYYRCSYYCFHIFFDGGLGLEGLCIHKGGMSWYRETPCRMELNRKCIYENRDELYDMMLEVVAGVNKAYNNALIKKNKALLDKAEELAKHN